MPRRSLQGTMGLWALVLVGLGLGWWLLVARGPAPTDPGAPQVPAVVHAPLEAEAPAPLEAAPPALPVAAQAEADDPQAGRGPAPRPPASPDVGQPGLRLESLEADEREAVATLVPKIDAGGPFAHARDGIVFQNRERRLPKHPLGYYREYTVPTPGLGHRGARRLIGGGAHELYYTRDHYGSFVMVREASSGRRGQTPPAAR